MWPDDPSPVRVFFAFTSAVPSAEGIAAVFLRIKRVVFSGRKTIATKSRSLYILCRMAPYGALKVVLSNDSLSLYQNYNKVTLLTSAGSSN
jgi:hypothetical protein